MNVARNLPATALIILSMIGLTGSGDARSWRAGPTDLAREYIQIIDKRSAQEIVVVFWVSPQLVPDGPNAQLGRQILTENFILGIVHADINLTGTFSFRTIAAPYLDVTATGNMAAAGRRARLNDNEVSREVHDTVNLFQSVLARTIGPMGDGIEWFIFDAAGIDSCKTGAFAVNYTGVSYTYETPIPGCGE